MGERGGDSVGGGCSSTSCGELGQYACWASYLSCAHNEASVTTSRGIYLTNKVLNRRAAGAAHHGWYRSSQVPPSLLSQHSRSLTLHHALNRLQLLPSHSSSSCSRALATAALPFELSPSTASGQQSEGPASGQHSEGSASGQHSEGSASGQHSEGPASGQHNEGPASGQHNEGPASGQHSEVPASGQHSEVPASGQHSEVPASGQHSEVPASGQHSEGSASGQHNEGPASGQHSEGPASGQPALLHQAGPPLDELRVTIAGADRNEGSCAEETAARFSELSRMLAASGLRRLRLLLGNAWLRPWTWTLDPAAPPPPPTGTT